VSNRKQIIHLIEILQEAVKWEKFVFIILDFLSEQ